jgi:hypothetical protein
MTRQLTDLFDTVEVTAPQQAGSLQVFGLRWPIGNGIAYTTLDDALASQTLDVTEVSEGGNVPTLKVVNKGDTLVFLMAGEQLAGAKQNRVLNTSILVAAMTELPIPVSCVEAGRWRYRSQKFASTGTTSHRTLRRIMCGHVTAHYQTEARPTSNQTEVWGEVSRKLGAMGSSSDTQALHQAYLDHQRSLEDVVTKLDVPAGCNGAAFALNGKVVGVDLFDRPGTLAKLWRKLIQAYYLDALEEPDADKPPASSAEVTAWLHTAAGAESHPFQSPGLGQDVRLEGQGIVGAGLMVENHPIHVELFAN